MDPSDQNADCGDAAASAGGGYAVSREMQSELFQTEQYVQMALQYLRMEKMTSDLVLQGTIWMR